MQINLIYDPSVSSAPAGFKPAVDYAAKYIDSLVITPATINIHVGYGEVNGSPIGAGSLGQSWWTFNTYTFAQIYNSLSANIPALTAALLPTSYSDKNATFMATQAEAAALNLLPSSTIVDGYVGFSSTQPFDYSTSGGGSPPANQYDFVGVVEHEITEVLGRDLGGGETISGYTNSHFPLDLFHYLAPGVLALKGTTPGYFSIDGGATNLNSFNPDPTGDFGDWANSAGNDSFRAFSDSGVANLFTAADVAVMQALGYKVASQGGPRVSTVTAATDNGASVLSAGHLVTITLNTNSPVTVTGTPTLQLNDNEVASYTIGSGSNALNFVYVVQPGDNVSHLKVTGLKMPSGATIQDSLGNNLSGGVSADLGLQINAAGAPPATTIQQEIHGLSAVLYGRALSLPGYSYFVSLVNQMPDASGVTESNAAATPISANDLYALSQDFIKLYSSKFDAAYGNLTDSQFIAALNTAITGNAGDPATNQAWSSVIPTLETYGLSAQASRAYIAAAMIYYGIGYDFSAHSSSLTSFQLQAGQQLQAAIDNKIAASISYAAASGQPQGAILVPHAIGDAADQASMRAIQNVTFNAATANAAIAHIQQVVANHDLLLI